MAFRTKVVREIPLTMINDDAYIQLLGEAKGYESKYAMFARVKLKGCSSARDFVLQRRRVYLGHLQVLFMTGRKLATFRVRQYPKALKDSLPSFGPKQFFYLLGTIALQGWAYLLALLDFYLFHIPYKWEMACTTKISLAEQMNPPLPLPRTLMTSRIAEEAPLPV